MTARAEQEVQVPGFTGERGWRRAAAVDRDQIPDGSAAVPASASLYGRTAATTSVGKASIAITGAADSATTVTDTCWVNGVGSGGSLSGPAAGWDSRPDAVAVSTTCWPARTPAGKVPVQAQPDVPVLAAGTGWLPSPNRTFTAVVRRFGKWFASKSNAVTRTGSVFAASAPARGSKNSSR
jgi:hypothetical protein